MSIKMRNVAAFLVGSSVTLAMILFLAPLGSDRIDSAGAGVLINVALIVGAVYLSRLRIVRDSPMKASTYLAVLAFALSGITYVLTVFAADPGIFNNFGIFLDGTGVLLATFSLAKKHTNL